MPVTVPVLVLSSDRKPGPDPDPKPEPALPGPPRCRDTRHEKKGANITRPRYQETTHRYNENDDVNSLVHELAFGIDICFGTVQLERRLLDSVTESLTRGARA